MLKLIAVRALLILPLTSCMTIMSTPDGFTTTIKTEPVRAVCHVSSPTGEYVYKRSGGSWAYPLSAVIVETPVTLALYFMAESIEFTCEAAGYQKATATLKPRLSWWILGNAFLGLSMPIGVATDLATGAARQYPGSVTIELEPTEAVTD